MAHIVVIGGGISGLSTAYHLWKIKKERNLDLKITLVEAASRLGGVINSEQEQGYVVEHGPDAFLVEKPWALTLCEELNLKPYLIAAPEGKGKAFVAWRGELAALPEGFSMIAPSRFWPFVTSPLFSPMGKLRAFGDLFLPKGNRQKDDESVARFIKRRLGAELFERAGQALVGGIYTADAGMLSASSAIPRFVELEREHGSIIRGLRGQRLGTTVGGARYSLFQTLVNGLSGLVEGLALSLEKETIVLGAEISEVARGASGWLVCKADETIAADGIVLAVPALRAARLLKGIDASLSRTLAEIESVASVVINFLLNADQISRPANGFGFVVPISEHANILAASFISEKYANRAPKGMVMVRVFIGGALMPQLFKKADQDLISLALTDLQKYLKLKGAPVKT